MSVLAVVASYFLGAIPTSYLVARAARGIDLREHGSRNLGATNLYRTLGWKFAVPVALFDIAKGAIPVVAFAPLASPSAFSRWRAAPRRSWATCSPSSCGSAEGRGSRPRPE